MELLQDLLVCVLLLSALGNVVSINNEEVIEGESVSLSVKLNLSEYQMIIWKFDTYNLVALETMNNTPICFPEYEGRCTLFENATLQLDNLTPADQGNYTVTVLDVETGLSMSGSVYLTVLSNTMNTTEDPSTQNTTSDELTTASDISQVPEYNPATTTDYDPTTTVSTYNPDSEFTIVTIPEPDYYPVTIPEPDYYPGPLLNPGYDPDYNPEYEPEYNPENDTSTENPEYEPENDTSTENPE
ncbi:C5a peptidase-like isoform X5 [Xenopus laevis]|uniref:C5a peptidase-like isoform X5 n=1 Tax=Xenopus laevis TaxID=8355 RepID=A0A8J1L7E8_XENLA|nr:C5a peptidase-like isoform X5 [Xenopus laevis]